ncbi:protein FAM228A [Clarias gariepinus]|uniref:protein FAM228A n=1 Tax=Clarias gariepinus TaxID=13013 RepID=UPI00234DFF63|nr:protein FAM228A [Clarias gariepinus]
MLAKGRKDYNGVITPHKPVPPHLLHHTSPRRAGQKSISSSEVRGVTQRSTTEADKAHTLSPCSLKQLQDQFLLERWDADAIVKPLLDTEHGFIKDLEHFLNHRDILRVRKRELLHKRWTECVWWPVQQSVEQRFTRWCHERGEPRKMDYTDYSTNLQPVVTYLL